MYPGTRDAKQAGGLLESGGVASLLSLAQAGQGGAPAPAAPSQPAQPPAPYANPPVAAAAALAGRPRSHSGASVLSAASSHSAATAAGADYYHGPPPPPPPGYPGPPHYGHHPLFHPPHAHATGAGYPHHAPMHPHHYGPPGLKGQHPLPGPYARAALPTYVPSAATGGGGGGGGTHQGVWSSELRAEYRGWLQVNRGISKETSITYSHAVHGVLKELVLKRIRDGRVGLPTHGMNARELRALIEEQPLEAERIIKRDKRSSYFRYLKEFLGMPMDDAPANGNINAPGPAAAAIPAPAPRAGGVKRPAPSSDASTSSPQPSSISTSASSASSAASSLHQAPSAAASLHHSAVATAGSLGPSASTGTAATGASGASGSVASEAALLLLEEEDNGAPACWSAGVRGEYLAWLQEPAARGGWGLAGGADEAVSYVRTGHVLIRKVLSDALGRANYQSMDKPSLGRALQTLIDEQPGLLARVIKGPKNRRLFQPLQRFFGLTNTNGAAASSASTTSAPPSASSSPIPSYAPPHYPLPPHGLGGMGMGAMGLPAPIGTITGSSSAASSRSSSPSRASLSGAGGGQNEPVWTDALKSAYKRWLELDRGFGAATVQNYVHSAVQTLRALVDLRLRKGGNQGAQPASRLTASEAAALLKEFAGELAAAGVVDVSQSHFRCLRSFLFGTTGMHALLPHDDDSDSEDEEMDGHHHGHGHGHRRHHHDDEEDVEEEEDDDMIIVAAAPRSAGVAPSAAAAAAAAGNPASARPSPERGAHQHQHHDGTSSSNCKGCRELRLDLADAQGESAQWRGRCEALAERVRELERALQQAQQQAPAPHHKRVAGLLASGGSSPAGSPLQGPEPGVGVVKGSPLVLAGEQERKEQEETSSVASGWDGEGAGGAARHPKKMRFRGPGAAADEAGTAQAAEQEGNSQLLSSSSSSSSSSSASSSSGGGSMGRAASGSKLASLLSAVNDESGAGAGAATGAGVKKDVVAVEEEVEPAPKLVAAVQA